MKRIWKKFTDWQMKWINRIYIEFELSELAMLWLWWIAGPIIALIIYLVFI